VFLSLHLDSSGTNPINQAAIHFVQF